MSIHNSDNEELEVLDVNNPEADPSMVWKPIGDNITTSKRKYTKKRKVQEIDFSIITILAPANFWKTLTDILKKPKVEFNLKKILNKLHQNLKAFDMQKSDRSWNTTFDSMKNLDSSTTSFDAQTASKFEDFFVHTSPKPDGYNMHWTAHRKYRNATRLHRPQLHVDRKILSMLLHTKHHHCP
jgi:hypothetical protein